MKIVLRISMLIMLLVVVCGCSKSRNGKEQIRNKEIRFLIWENPRGIKQHEPLIKEFEKRNPSFKVKLEITSTSGSEKILTQAASNTLADVVQTVEENIVYFAQKGLIQPLDQFFTKGDPDFNINDFYESVVKQMTYKGKVWIVPKGGNTFVLYYNKKMFDEAKLKYPDETWTWTNFLAAAKALTKDKNGDGKIDQFGFLVDGGMGSLAVWLKGNGANYVSEDGKRVTINSPEAIYSLQFLIDLVKKYHVAPTMTEVSDVGWYEELFKMKKIAMFISGPYIRASFWNEKDLEWDIAPLPKGPKTRPYILAFCGWVMSKNTKYPKESWEFLKILGGRLGARNFAKFGQDIPAINDKEAIDIWNDPTRKPEHVKVYIDCVKKGKHYFDPYNGAWTIAIGRYFSEAFELAMIGKKDLKDALDERMPEMQKSLDNFWKDFNSEVK